MNKVHLSDIATIVMGQSPKGETCNFEGKGKPLLNGPTEFGDFYPTANQFTTAGNKFSLSGDILFCVRGSTTGRMNWSDSEYVLGRGLASIRHKKGNRFNHYLKYLIDLNLESILKSTSGSTFPNLTSEMLNSFVVNILPEQKAEKVNDFLKNFDTIIELNNKINLELEAMAKTLYDYWFVQFDFPNQQGKPYKSSGGKIIYNAELKREIPEGWVSGTLGDIAELVRGVTYDASEIKNKNDFDVIPVLRATNISGNIIDLNNMVFVPRQNVSSIQVLNKYDILITMSSGSKEHIGKNGFFYFDKEVAFGAFCAKIVAKNNYKFYLYSYTQSDFMFSTIKNECLGTNINNLNSSLVKGFKIIIPPKKLIETFNDKVNSVYKKIGNNLIENQQLSEIRDWLLPMLMNGQVR